MIRASIAAAALAVFFLAAPLVSRADPPDAFTGAITPLAVQPPATGNYTISITNQPSSPDGATHASIEIPTGFTVLPATEATVSGCINNSSWSVLLGGGTIDLTAPDGTSLCPHGRLELPFSAETAPVADDSYPWTTTLTGSGVTFIAQSQPTLIIDGTAPETTIVGDPPAFTDGSASFAFSGTDSGSGIAGFECSLNGSPFATCSNPASYTGLVEGANTFAVRSVDAVANPDPTPAQWGWTVDLTPPETAIDAVPDNPTASRVATFEFHGSDASSGVSSFDCALDNASFVTCSTGATYQNLLDGTHTFRVRAADSIGNRDATPAAYTWVVDTVHPLVTLTEKPSLLTNSTTATFAFSATDASGFECSLDGAAFASCASPELHSDLGDGSHTFAVRAVSAGGTPGAATSYTWTVDTVPPHTVIASRPPAVSNSAFATFTFTSSEDGSSFACSVDSSGFTPCGSPKTYSGLGDGSHVFRVQAVDAAGNADPSVATYSWQISGVGPPTQDLRPPGNVSRLKRNVGYRRFQLRWTRPADPDFDHVGVYVSTNPKTPPRTLVYRGARQSYTDPRFRNGQYHRYVVVSYDHAENASGGTPALVKPSALLTAPRDGGVVRKTLTFRWAGVRGASFYNVQLYYQGQKVLSAWPHKPRQLLSRSWRYGGHTFSLRRGTYVWYVWPAFGPRSKSRYGQLLGQATFRGG